MDLKEDLHRNSPGKVNENLRNQDRGLSKSQESVLLSPIKSSSVPLSALNKNPREYVEALGKAQKEWIENSKSWPVKDELQNAQIQWLNDFSDGKILCTSTPHPKKTVESRHSLPFTPPKKPKDLSSRRGVVVYKPPVNALSSSEHGAEKGPSVKIVTLEEPEKVATSKKNQDYVKITEQSQPTETKKHEKSPQRRYITVRKKLQRLKNLSSEEEHFDKSGDKTVVDNRDHEKKEAARQYILKKRMERERELETQRRNEAKAEAEKKARMERLRETQQRLVRSAVKRSQKSPERRNTQESDEDSSHPCQSNSPSIARPSTNRSELNEATSGLPAAPPSSPSIRNSSEKMIDEFQSPRKSEKEGSSKPNGEDVNLHIVDLLMDANIPSHKKTALLELLDKSVITGKDTLADIVNSQEYKDLLIEPSKSSVPSQPAPAPSPIPSSTGQNSNNQNKLVHPQNTPTFTSPKEENDIAQFVEKDTVDKPVKAGHRPTKPWNEIERPYNILRAVTNKQAAYEHYNNISRMKNKSCEKGVQAGDEEPPVTISEEFIYSKNESLKTPTGSLITRRVSEPGGFEGKHKSAVNLAGKNEIFNKDFLATLEKKATDHSKNETVSPNGKGRPSFNAADFLNVPADLSLLPKSSPAFETDNAKERLSNVEDKPAQSLLLPSTFNLELSFNSSQREQSRRFTHEGVTSAGSSHLWPTSESHGASRDSRITEEIKKLESFNSSITTVIEKNKSVLSLSDSNLKLSLDESILPGRATTSSTVKSNLGYLHSQGIAQPSQSSSSVDLSEDITGTNIAKFSLKMYNERLKDEEARSIRQAALFKMKENKITEKAKAELAYLELEKKKMKDIGNEDGLKNIRKKIRGLVIKLEHDLEELNKLKKAEKAEYRKRKQKLMDRINSIKMQLKMPSPAPKAGQSITSSVFSVLEAKAGPNTDKIIEPKSLSLLDKKKIELEVRESLLAERLAELENISSWKKRLEEGEKRIQELENRLKLANAAGGETEGERTRVVERGTSPFRLTSDESQGEGQKELGSYSDAFDRASSSSNHEKLEEKTFQKMLPIKVPLLSPAVALKRRHSSGSDESQLHSQTETQSDASDMEGRVLALQQQLKQRKAKLESLHREYKKSQKERLIAKEKSLLSQIQAYDLYIEQVMKELDKEKSNLSANVKIVRPLIKQPKVISDRRKSDTWLIQAKAQDVSSSSSLFETPSEFLQKVVKDKTISEALAKKASLLDSKKLDKLCLKSKFTLTSSQSDPNLSNSEEKLSQGRVSHSSESCESDMEKKKIVLTEYPISNEEAIQSPQSSYQPDEIDSQDQIPSVSISSGQENKKNSEQHTDIENRIESKETVGTTEFVENSPVSSETHVSEETDTSAKTDNGSLSVVTDVTISQDKVAKEDQAMLSPDRKDAPSVQETGSAEEIIPEVSNAEVIPASESSDEKISELDVLSEKHSVPINEISASQITSENLTAVDGSERTAELEINDQHSDLIETEEKSQYSSSVEASVKSVLTSETPSVFVPSKDEDKKEESIVTDNSNLIVFTDIPTNEEKTSIEEESKLEESAKEVTYLEISDHVYQGTFETDVSEKEEVTEDKSLAEELEEATVEQVEKGQSDVEEEQEKSTFTVSEAIDVVPKSASEDLSDGSFPLPVTNKEIAKSEDLPSVAEEVEDHTESEAAKELSEVMEVIDEQASSNSDLQVSSVANVPSKDASIDRSVVEEVQSPSNDSNNKGQLIDDSPTKESFSQSISKSNESTPLKAHLAAELEKSFSESEILHEGDIDSPFEELTLEDSLEENLHLGKLKLKSNLFTKGEEVEENESTSDTTDSLDSPSCQEDKPLDEVSCHRGKLADLDSPAWSQGTDPKSRDGAPLIDALQREGGSALDVIWRSIAESAIEEGKKMVISSYIKRIQPDSNTSKAEKDTAVSQVGDHVEDVLGDELEKLSPEQAAEALRLQQLKIDKEIEELQEEEARRYYYVRAIPNKPPPPYTPRKSSLVGNVVEAAEQVWSGIREPPESFMPGSHLREFIWDLAAEIVSKACPPPAPQQPPWVKTRRPRPRKPIKTKEELLEEVEKEAKIFLGVEKRKTRDNLIIRWSRKRRDHVDEILVRESQEEEWEWTDFTEEENIIKNKIAESLFQESLDIAVQALAQAFDKKLSGTS